MKVLCFTTLLAVFVSLVECGPLHKAKKVKAQDEYFRDVKNSDQPDIKAEDLPRNGRLFEEDILMDEDLRKVILGAGDKRSAEIVAEIGHKKHWPNGEVPYKLHKSLAPIVRKQILKAIEELRHLTCIRYVPKKKGDKDYVVFKNGRGCSSYVGRKGGKQNIHLGIYCKRIGTVLHEMMHAIGIVHEQSRYDRDRFIKVIFSNIKQKNAFNFRKYSINNLDNMKMPYNYYSVMHYSNYAFSNNGRPTLISKVYPHLAFGQRKQLSHLDVQQINKLYNCHTRHYNDIMLHDDMTPSQAERKRDEDERKKDQMTSRQDEKGMDEAEKNED